MYYNTQNKHKKLKPGLVASYNNWPGNWEGLFWFQHFINLSLTYLLKTLTHLQLREPHGAQWPHPGSTSLLPSEWDIELPQHQLSNATSIFRYTKNVRETSSHLITIMYIYELCRINTVWIKYRHRLMASIPRQPGQTGTKKVKPMWILMNQELMRWKWHQLDHMQIIYTLLQTANNASNSPLIFLQAGCPSDAQPTVSKHWRHESNIKTEVNVKSCSVKTKLLLAYSMTHGTVEQLTLNCTVRHHTMK